MSTPAWLENSQSMESVVLAQIVNGDHDVWPRRAAKQEATSEEDSQPEDKPSEDAEPESSEDAKKEGKVKEDAKRDAKPGEDSKPEPKDTGTRSELRSLQERYKKGSVETVATNEYKAADFDENSEYALVSTQKFDEKGQFTKTELKINSEALLRVLRKVIVSHPEAPSGFNAAFEVESPFAFLFHYWEELEEYSRTTGDGMERSHLALLLDFMEAEMGRQRKNVRQKVENGSIEFEALWTIFKPGQLIYENDNGYPTLLRLTKTVYEYSEKTGRRFEVHAEQTANDGTGIYRRRTIKNIFEKKLFGGGTSAKITSLPAYPFSFVKEGDKLIEKLRSRGEQSSKFVGVTNVRYDGQAQYQRLPPKSFFHPDLSEFETTWLGYKEVGRVVIDGKTYLEDYEYESFSISKTWPDEYRSWAEKQFGSFDKANHVLCVPHVFGFSLQRKDWCKFYVDCIQPVVWNDDAVNSLILDDKQKLLLEALVKGHKYPDDARETATQKGKGLVVLLHGTPGSGKTLTAEVAAEIAHTALLPITLGELYEFEYFDEWKLRILLQYATIWQAVVLIDEADVFLEARATGRDSNQQRNALVAVFLKYLEYFSGIVFLTSNRVDDFDAAMKSRIHLALQYAPPADQLRRQIWATRLAAIPADELAFDDLAADVARLARQHEMNGREIANSINTARTLARHSGARLALHHIDTVVGIWSGFNASLQGMMRQQQQRSKAGGNNNNNNNNNNRHDSFVPKVQAVEADASPDGWEIPE